MSDKPCVPPPCHEPVDPAVTTGYVFGPDDTEAEEDWWGDAWAPVSRLLPELGGDGDG